MSLVEFCKQGDLEEVKDALQRGADVNTKDEFGRTGLMEAVRNKHNSVVELLLKTPNIDVNLKDDRGSCALHLAVRNNDALKLLLNVPNIDVNIVDGDCWSVLHWAIWANWPNCPNDTVEALKLLLNVSSLDVNIVNNNGETALHWAVKFSLKIETLKLLLNASNIDVNIVNKYGETALHFTVDKYIDYSENNIEALKLLLSHPSLTALTLNQKEKKKGATPVMLAVKYNSLEARALLAADPRVNLDTTDKEGRGLEQNSWWFICKKCFPPSIRLQYRRKKITLPLYEFPWRKGDLEEVKDALQRGVDVNTKGKKGWTALMQGVYNGHNSMVELLLKTPNIDVNLRNKKGMCALHMAVWMKNNEALKLLLSVPNIDVNLKDDRGRSALHHALGANGNKVWNKEALKLLLYVPNINVNNLTDIGETYFLKLTMSLVEFCEEGDLEGVRAALERGVDVNARGKKCWTGLMEAVFNKHNSVVELLLKTPNIDVNFENNRGRCALHLAVEKNNEALKLLLNVPNIDVISCCALHCAVSNYNNEALKLLLNVPNIDVNYMKYMNYMNYRNYRSYVDYRGWSPFHIAVSNYCKNSDALNLLLSVASLDVNCVTYYDGQTALHLAVRYSYIYSKEAGDSYSIEALKLLLSLPSLTALTLNKKQRYKGDTPVMLAVRENRLEHLALLAADPRVDLDTTDKEGKSLEENTQCPETLKVVNEAKRRQETTTLYNLHRSGFSDSLRLVRAQKRQVSKVLLDGLYDPDSPINKLLGVRTEIVGEIIWKKLVENWQIFPELG